MRYKFYEQLTAIKKNPKAVLPADINKPVFDFLERIGCVIGATVLKKFQDKIEYGTIELIRDDVPNAKISLQVDCGMCEGWKQYESNKVGQWTCISYKTVKNANLDKKKPIKEGSK